jgi:hypothetical protein
VYVLCLYGLYLLVIDQHNERMWPKSFQICCYVSILRSPITTHPHSAEVKAIPLLSVCGSYSVLWSEHYLYLYLKYRDTSSFQEL